MGDSLDRPLPHSAEAERAVLGAVLLDNDIMEQAARLLTPSDFYVPAYKKIFMVMLDLFEQGKPIDAILTGEVLKKHNELEAVGGVSALTGLTYGLPHFANISHYADLVKTDAKNRWLLKFSSRLEKKVMDGDSSPEETMSWVVDNMARVQQVVTEKGGPKTIDMMFDDQSLRYLMFHKGISSAIPTGFPELDRNLLGGGWIPSLVYVVAARPSMGKTTLALDSLAMAAAAGFRTFLVSRETEKAAIIDRLVAAKAGVDRFKISSGISKADYERAMEALTSMRHWPLVLDDSSMTILEIDRRIAEQEKEGTPVQLLGLDYLQLMRGEAGDGRTQEVSDISRGVKWLAMKWNIPAISISQTTRAPGKENREPELYDLRESGQIEQDADAVIFIHGDGTEVGVDFMQKEILCKKQRDGPHFREIMDMNAKLVTFRTPAMLGHKAPATNGYKVKPREGDTKTSAKNLVQSKAGRQRTLARELDPEEDM